MASGSPVIAVASARPATVSGFPAIDWGDAATKVINVRSGGIHWATGQDEVNHGPIANRNGQLEGRKHHVIDRTEHQRALSPNLFPIHVCPTQQTSSAVGGVHIDGEL